MEAEEHNRGPGKAIQITALVILAAAAAAVIAVRQIHDSRTGRDSGKGPAGHKGLPALIEVGSDTCTPCKQMKNVLDELRSEYEGRLHITIINLAEDSDAQKRYNISLIPTQIFYDASGTELFRHEGFFPKEDIIKKWKELGIDLNTGKPDTSPAETPVDPLHPLPHTGTC